LPKDIQIRESITIGRHLKNKKAKVGGVTAKKFTSANVKSMTKT